VKELLPIVIACMICGKKAVAVHCDNQAVVEVINAGYCEDGQLMQLLRCLFFISSVFGLAVKATHIGKHRSRC